MAKRQDKRRAKSAAKAKKRELRKRKQAALRAHGRARGRGQGTAPVEQLLDALTASRAVDQESLLLRCGVLKRCLVLWSVSEELVDRLRAYGRGMPVAEGEERDPDEIIERFIGSYRFEDGRSVHEAFVARFPLLDDEDRRIVLGWKDTIEGIFEIVQHAGDHLELLNLVDELTYIVRSNQGAAGLKQAPRVGFLLGRVCPLGDEWLMSGEHRVLKPHMADELLAMAAQLALKVPRLFFRNPSHLERGWEQQRKMYEDFVDHFGTDEVLVRGTELQAIMDGFMTSQQERVRDEAEREGKALDPALVGAAPVRMPVPRELSLEREVAVLHHPRWGQGFYLGYGEVRRAFIDPKRALRRGGSHAVRSYLEDADLDPLPLLLLGNRHPDAASQLFASILGRPGFDWERDGEALLREYKGDHYENPLPRVVPLPERQVAAMRRTSRVP